jgi:magnesium transporter
MTHDTAEAQSALSEGLVEAVTGALEAGEEEKVRALVRELRAPDLADLIRMLDPGLRARFVQALGPALDFEVLSELDESTRDQLFEELPNELLARAAAELDTDDAAYVLENLEQSDKEEILAQLPQAERRAIERNLEYPEGTAGRLMSGEFVAVPPFWNVGQVIDFLREADDLPDTFSEIFVVDPAYRVLGSIDLSRLLRSKRHVKVEEIMEKHREAILATEDEGEVARKFQRYDLLAAPVVDAHGRLVGVITVDDVVEVIQEEADEEIKALGGVGHESVSDPVPKVLAGRFTWLFVNLLTALLASWVISWFDASLQQMVALAVLMPIVASMGGNAGTQTMTVTVRALATRELGAFNLTRFVLRQAAAGLLNGLLFAIIMGSVVLLWYGMPLGLVLAVAIIINLTVAALVGILVPLTLTRLGHDPAVSSSVFVTTVTDVVGFFAFLGLATLWLLR